MLNHPNIVSMREVYHQPTKSYLIMEPMFGGELFDRIVKKQCYTEAEACDSIVKVANAIQYCHSKGIVHRDLKPENLLYANTSDDARLTVADFGLAKRVLSIDELMTSAWHRSSPAVVLAKEPSTRDFLLKLVSVGGV